MARQILNVKKINKLQAAFFLELNLEGEFRLALRLSPDDEDEQETHREDHAEGCEVPHRSASLHCQYTEHQD